MATQQNEQPNPTEKREKQEQQQQQPRIQQGRGRQELDVRRNEGRGLQRSREGFTSPFSLVRRMMEDMERMFGAPSLLPDMWSSGFESMWSPQVEVFERGDQLVVRADVPGLDRKDIRLELTPDGLLLEGERKNEREERDRGFYRTERSYGFFQRLIPLPETVDVENATADMKDGVLEVCFKQTDQTKRRRKIEISEGKGAEGSKRVH